MKYQKKGQTCQVGEIPNGTNIGLKSGSTRSGSKLSIMERGKHKRDKLDVIPCVAPLTPSSPPIAWQADGYDWGYVADHRPEGMYAETRRSHPCGCYCRGYWVGSLSSPIWIKPSRLHHIHKYQQAA
jgi:hypothetical protein